ncbi:MAG: hypothetical protein WCE54_08465 [Ignavibacteriaceae bacterium]
MNNFNKIIFLLLFMLLISSCKKERNIRISKSNILVEKRDGLIYKQKSEKPYTGIIIDTVNNKIMEYSVKDGVKKGQFKISHLNGQVEILGNMKDDKNEGKWEYYYPDGQLESVGDFKNDTPSGKWIFYYASGIKKEEGKYIEGKRDGKWVEYDSAGKVINYTNFSKGDTVK